VGENHTDLHLCIDRDCVSRSPLQDVDLQDSSRTIIDSVGLSSPRPMAMVELLPNVCQERGSFLGSTLVLLWSSHNGTGDLYNHLYEILPVRKGNEGYKLV